MSANHLVTINDWQACINSNDGIVVLSCTVTAVDSGATVAGAGLILNNSGGEVVGSSYAEFTNSNSMNLSLNLPAGDIKVGDSIAGVASGEVQGQHFFIQQELTVGSC